MKFLAVLPLALIGTAQAAKVTFCVRDGGNEDIGYGPFEKEKTKEQHIEDMTTEWDEGGKQVKLPGKKAHVHGIDGRLNHRCQLVHENGDRKKLTLCYREKGSDGGFSKKKGNVEEFTPEFMEGFNNLETAWAGDLVMIKGNRQEVAKKQFLLDNCKGSDDKYVPSVYGDPHFSTWYGESFDFHGACDLVMVDNPSFANGLGLKIHIRTTISTWWSHISTAAVQIGDNTIEVMGNRDGLPKYWINQGEEKEVQNGETMLGDFRLTFKLINNHQANVRLDLEHGNGVSLETYKRFVRVNMGTQQPDYFAGSVGILGSFSEKEMLARDGKTIMEDPIAFGQEWQVLSSEPMLFHDAGEVQHPNKCIMPSVEAKAARRLGEGVTQDEAELACARVTDGLSRDACIFDVMATNDKDMAGSY